MTVRTLQYWKDAFEKAEQNRQPGAFGPNDGNYACHNIKRATKALQDAISSTCVGYGWGFYGLEDSHPLAHALNTLGDYILKEDIRYWDGIFKPEDFYANSHLRGDEPWEWWDDNRH